MSGSKWYCLVLAIGLAGCNKGGDADTPQTAVTVHTAVATVGAVPQLVNAIGTVTPRPGHFAELSAPASTRVARIAVSLGQRVHAGELLVEFEQAPFVAAARSAEAAQAAAQGAYDRAVRLAEAGVLPRKDVDQAAADLAAAQSNAITARRALELATVRSPISGVVTRMDAILSQPVDLNQLLIEVVDPAALDIVFNVSPDEAALLHTGARVAIWPAENRSGDTLGMGTVTAVAASVDSASRAVPVRAQLVRSRRQLRVGESVAGRITLGVHPGAVTIPAAALVPEGEGFRVFVVTADGLARARDVVVGSRNDSLVEITEGVAAGETVVTYGAYGLVDSVRVVRAQP